MDVIAILEKLKSSEMEGNIFNPFRELLWPDIDKGMDEIKQLQATSTKQAERIKAMYAGALSPECRLNGYAVITTQQGKRIAKQAEEINGLEKALSQMVDLAKDTTATACCFWQVQEAIKVLGKEELPPLK